MVSIERNGKVKPGGHMLRIARLILTVGQKRFLTVIPALALPRSGLRFLAPG